MIRSIAGYGIQVPRWEVRNLINSLACWKGKSTAIVSVGIDLAKKVFAVHGVDEAGKPALVRPTFPRARLLELIASLPPYLIGIEACSGAHHWAGEFAKFGHTVRLMEPKFVIPYRLSGKRGKNDAADAAAICEAVTRPTMRFMLRDPTCLCRAVVRLLWHLRYVVVHQPNIGKRYPVRFELALERNDNRNESSSACSCLLRLHVSPEADIALDLSLEFGDEVLQTLLVGLDASRHVVLSGSVLVGLRC